MNLLDLKQYKYQYRFQESPQIRPPAKSAVKKPKQREAKDISSFAGWCLHEGVRQERRADRKEVKVMDHEACVPCLHKKQKDHGVWELVLKRPKTTTYKEPGYRLAAEPSLSRDHKQLRLVDVISQALQVDDVAVSTVELLYAEYRRHVLQYLLTLGIFVNLSKGESEAQSTVDFNGFEIKAGTETVQLHMKECNRKKMKRFVDEFQREGSVQSLLRVVSYVAYVQTIQSQYGVILSCLQRVALDKVETALGNL